MSYWLFKMDEMMEYILMMQVVFKKCQSLWYEMHKKCDEIWLHYQKYYQIQRRCCSGHWHTSLFHFNLTQESRNFVKGHIVNYLNFREHKKSILHILLVFCFVLWLFLPYMPFKNVKIILHSKAIQKQVRAGLGLPPLVCWLLAVGH